MKRKMLAWISTPTLSAALALALLGTGGVALHASAGETGEHAKHAAPGHERSGWHRGRGAPMAHLCATGSEARWQRLAALVDGFAEFDDRQQAAWDALSLAMDEAGESMRGHCAAIREQGRPYTAPERLARMETTTTAMSEALRIVRPPFETFYETLDSDQQSALDGILGHHRGMRHRRSGNTGATG